MFFACVELHGHPSDVMDVLGLNVTMSITSIGTQGYPGTGKTSVLDLAMGKDPAPTWTSTGCIDPPSRYLVTKSEDSDGIKWEHVTTDKVFDLVCDAVKKTIGKNPPEWVKTLHSSVETSPFSVGSRPELSVSSTNTISFTSSLFLDLLKKTKESKGSGVIFDCHWMLLTDSGGQPSVLDAHALFLRNSSLQIFTLKLNELLSQRPEFAYFIDGESLVCSKFNLPLTNQQTIETMAKLVCAVQPPFTPSAIESPKRAKFAIIGTFEDKAHLCSETVEDKETILNEILEPYKPFQIRNGGNLILPVNAITTDKENRKKLVEKLQTLITNASGITMKVIVKLRWFVFLLSMFTRADKQMTPILTLDECLELGKFLEMKESEVHKAIRFFNDISLIMHFDTPALSNFVIVNSKPLLDKLTFLLNAPVVDERFLADNMGLILPPRAKELLQQHGRFSQEVLESFLKFSEPITLNFFLNVLEHVKAVVAIDNTSEYFMPCVLPYASDEQCVPHPSPPWVIRFRLKLGIEDVYIPVPFGYLPVLTIFLLSHVQSLFQCCLEDLQFRNLIKLRYKQGGNVYIAERHLQLEVYFTFCDRLPKDCTVIRGIILNAISLTEERLHISQNVITVIDSFLCSCDEMANFRHICTYNQESEIAVCEVTRQECNLSDQNLLWIKAGETY